MKNILILTATLFICLCTSALGDSIIWDKDKDDFEGKSNHLVCGIQQNVIIKSNESNESTKYTFVIKKWSTGKILLSVGPGGKTSSVKIKFDNDTYNFIPTIEFIGQTPLFSIWIDKYKNKILNSNKITIRYVTAGMWTNTIDIPIYVINTWKEVLNSDFKNEKVVKKISKR